MSAFMDRKRQVRAASCLIATLVHSRLYGEVKFILESGNIVHVTVMRNSKIYIEAGRLLDGKDIDNEGVEASQAPFHDPNSAIGSRPTSE